MLEQDRWAQHLERRCRTPTKRRMGAIDSAIGLALPDRARFGAAGLAHSAVAVGAQKVRWRPAPWLFGGWSKTLIPFTLTRVIEPSHRRVPIYPGAHHETSSSGVATTPGRTPGSCVTSWDDEQSRWVAPATRTTEGAPTRRTAYSPSVSFRCRRFCWRAGSFCAMTAVSVMPDSLIIEAGPRPCPFGSRRASAHPRASSGS